MTSPKLNLVEAMSVIKTLEEESLIYPMLNSQDNKTSYLINERKGMGVIY